jgi:hypothetical protein
MTFDVLGGEFLTIFVKKTNSHPDTANLLESLRVKLWQKGIL